MFSLKNKSALGAVLFSQFLFWSCNDADFSGSSTTKPPKKDPVVDPAPPPLPASRAPDEKTTPVSDEIVSNSDGTVTEKFFGQTEVEAQADVEIIFVVDTSGSMDDEKSMLEQNISKFLTDLSNSGRLNHQVFMIGSGFNFPATDPSRFSIINDEVGSWNALKKVQNFLDNPGGSLPLRANATKEIVVVTDDDSLPGKGGVRASDFISYLNTKTASLGQIHVNGFIWLPTSVKNSNCTKANQGNAYLELANDPTFGGDMFDLCSKDWSALLGEFAKKIISSNAQLEFKLKTAVNENQGLKVFVNDVEVESTYWTYSSTRNSIVFDAENAPKAGDIMAVIYSPIE